MFRFRVRKIPGPLLKFTQKAVLFQDISIFFVLKTELYLSSGTYFFFWKLVFHFTFFVLLAWDILCLLKKREFDSKSV